MFTMSPLTAVALVTDPLIVTAFPAATLDGLTVALSPKLGVGVAVTAGVAVGVAVGTAVGAAVGAALALSVGLGVGAVVGVELDVDVGVGLVVGVGLTTVMLGPVTTAYWMPQSVESTDNFTT